MYIPRQAYAFPVCCALIRYCVRPVIWNIWCSPRCLTNVDIVVLSVRNVQKYVLLMLFTWLIWQRSHLYRLVMLCSCLQDSALLQSDCSPFPHGQAESRQAIPHHGTKPEKMPVRCHWTTKCSPEEYWWNKVSSYRYNMSTPAAYWSRPKWAKPSGWYWQTKRGCQNSVFENMNL